MRSEILKAAAMAAMVFSASSVAQAGEPCNPDNLVESGTFTAYSKSVGFLVSVHWGDGVLTLNNGETHKFHIIGGKLIETGFGETHLKGTVYNLKNIEDFEGVYYGAASQTALIKGPKGGITAKNSSNCVYLHGVSSSKGVRLSPPGPGGVEIKLSD